LTVASTITCFEWMLTAFGRSDCRLNSYMGSSPQPQKNDHNSPVELPTSSDPANSPLPHYQSVVGRQISWSAADTEIRGDSTERM
jgi:hypothetical protein